MFISIDAEGKVIVNTIKKVVIVYNVTKHVIIDPNKVNAPLFNSIACRFE
jgi:sortase (surface protein transpeptidase)